MLDKDTLIISDDTDRGEPRGSRSKKADPAQLGLGSCIDCGWCVQVCPTGIDIRNGLQCECIGCAACVDVCDEVIVYSVVLVLICGALATSLALRAPFRVDVLRDRASLARQVEEGFVENVYRLQIVNATELPQRYKISADGLPGLALREPVLTTVAPTEARWVSVTLRLPPEAAAAAKPGAHPVHFVIERPASPVDEARSEREKSTFVIPR